MCVALGHGNPSEAVKRHVEPEDKSHVSLGLRGSDPAIVNESGLYSLIMGSKKPEAKAFKRWVTSEVLPTIRKTGGYMTPAVAQTAVTDPTEFLARAILIANETIQKLALQSKGMEPTVSKPYASRPTDYRTAQTAQEAQTAPAHTAPGFFALVASNALCGAHRGMFTKPAR